MVQYLLKWACVYGFAMLPKIFLLFIRSLLKSIFILYVVFLVNYYQRTCSDLTIQLMLKLFDLIPREMKRVN